LAARTVTEKELSELVQRTAEPASALIRGDVRTYLGLIKHADDYRLMAPFGGAPEHGFDASSERMSAMERFFQGGEVNLELVQSYTSGDMVVLVVVERQHGHVGGLPDQDWSLRVTVVFRREGSEWQPIHRHADPLTHDVSLEQLASLARG
jgi:ketosteroid isomerase-like protein